MKDKGGRPTKITEDVLAKLEAAFLGGHTDREACLIVGIDPSTLTRYCDKNESFAHRKELLKEQPTIIARKTLVIGVGDNPELALKYLERKRKDEFSLKTELDVTTDGEKIGGFIIIKKDEQTDLPRSTSDNKAE